MRYTSPKTPNNGTPAVPLRFPSSLRLITLFPNDESRAVMCSLIVFLWCIKILASFSEETRLTWQMNFYWFFLTVPFSLLNVTYSIFLFYKKNDFLQLLRINKYEDKHSYGRLPTESQMTNDLKEIAQELPAIEKENGRYQCSDVAVWLIKNCGRSEEVLYCICIQLGSGVIVLMLLHERLEGQEVLNWREPGSTSWRTYPQLKQENMPWQSRKTEMMYQVVATAIRQEKAVCIATPRIDVCG